MVSKRSKMNHSNTHRTFITLYCSQATQTKPDNSEAEASAEDSDFPPCRIGSTSPIMSRPLPVARPSRYLPKAAASSEQLQQQPTIIISSSEEPEEPPQSHRCRQLNTGLGQANILNTVDTDSDFPPCRIGSTSPIMSRPSPVARPSRYLPKAAASGVQQPTIIISSSEEPEEPPQPHRCRQLNTGLGQANILNTVDTKVLLFIPYM